MGNSVLPLIRPEILVPFLIPLFLFEIPSKHNQNVTTSHNTVCYLPWIKSSSCFLYYWNVLLTVSWLLFFVYSLCSSQNELVKICQNIFSAKNHLVVSAFTQSKRQSESCLMPLSLWLSPLPPLWTYQRCSHLVTFTLAVYCARHTPPRKGKRQEAGSFTFLFRYKIKSPSWSSLHW